MDEIIEKVIPLKEPGFNNSAASDCDRDDSNFSKIDNFSRDLPEELNQACSPWEVEKKVNGDFDNGNVFPAKTDTSKEKNSTHKSTFYPMDVDQCDIGAKNGYGKLSRLKKNSDKENIASIPPERKIFSSQDNSSPFILNKKRQTVVSPSSFPVASSKKLRLDGRKNSPISPESPILQLHNFSEQLSISSPSPKHSPDLFESPQSPKFFSSSLPSALAPLSCPDGDFGYEDDSMSASSSLSHMISNNNDVAVDSNKKTLKTESDLDGKTSYINGESCNENGWNYAVFDLEAEEKSTPTWPLEENSRIKEIFNNTNSDRDYSKSQHSGTNKKATRNLDKIKKSPNSNGSSNVVHGIIYLSDSDDEGVKNKSVSELVPLKGKSNKYENKIHRKKRYWNASPKYKEVEAGNCSSHSDIASHSFSDAEIEILPIVEESSKKSFKKPFNREKMRNAHMKHKNNVELHSGNKDKKINCLSDSESDSLNSGSFNATGRLQKSPRCQLFPRNSPVFPRMRDSVLKNSVCSSHRSSSSSVLDQELEQIPDREMQLYRGPLSFERGRSKNHSRKMSHPKSHCPPGEITVLNSSAMTEDKKDDSVPHSSKNGANNIPYRSSDRVNHSSPQLHLSPHHHHHHHHHHRHHRSHNRRGTHQEISRNRDSFRTRLRLDPIIYDSENEEESSSEPPTNPQDLTNSEHAEVLTCDNNSHNSVAPSPDPVQQLQQLESDEMLARMLQAQFDAELDIPEFQRSSRRSHHRPPMPLPTGRRPTGRAWRTHGSPSISPAFADLNSFPHLLGFHNWEPSSSDESDLDFLLPSVIMDTPLVEFINGDMDWRENGVHFMRLDRPRVARGRSTRNFTRRNRAWPNFMVGNDGNDYEALWELAEQIGEVTKRGLSRREINRLPTRIHSSPPEGFPASQCHICMCDYEEGDRLRILPCFHEFHAPCIDRWIKDNATCPVCRARVNTERTSST